MDNKVLHGNLTTTTERPITDHGRRLDNPDSLSRLTTLTILWFIIVFGNILVLSVSRWHFRKQIPEFLILALACADLINGILPVSISVGLYMFTERGFRSIHSKELCLFYNSTATASRLSSCFIATVMAVDRAISIFFPIYYRTELGVAKVRRVVLILVAIAIILACIPLTGTPAVYSYDVVCSFDFGSSYAVLLMLLGYTQLVIVAVSYVLVIKGLMGFLERQVSMRRRQQCPSITNENEVVKYHSLSHLQSIHEDEARDTEVYKTTKKFAQIMGMVVFLFYVSWLPIVISITIRLATGKYNETLQFISARMSLVSSTANPLVYALMSRTYRRGYLYSIRMLCTICGCPKPDNPYNQNNGKSSFARIKKDSANSQTVQTSLDAS